jgi:hypothetical protein
MKSLIIDPHVASKNYAVGKNVVEFHGMNAQTNSSYQNDTSVVVVRAWIKDLYNYTPCRGVKPGFKHSCPLSMTWRHRLHKSKMQPLA